MAGTKRKIAIAKRETKSQRSVAFSKRRKGLFKKASELCRLSGVSVAVLATPPSEKPDTIYSFGHSSVDVVVEAFLSGCRPTLPPPAETDDGFVGNNIDDPDELRGLIERFRELKNHVLVLLENRAKQNASLERSNSALPIQEFDIHAGTSVILGKSDFGNGVSAENSLGGTEEEKNSKILETHINGGSVNNDSSFNGFCELEVNSGAFGNFDTGNYIFDYGFSSLYPDFAGIGEDRTLGTIGSGYNELDVNCGCSAPFGSTDFSDSGFSPACTEFVAFSYAGTEADKNTRTLETDIANGGSFGAYGNSNVETVFDYGFSLQEQCASSG